MCYRYVVIIVLLILSLPTTGQPPKLWIHDFSPSNKSSPHEQLSEDGILYLQERLELICDTLQKRKAGRISSRPMESMMNKNTNSKQKRFEDALTNRDYVIWSTYNFDANRYYLTTRFAPHEGNVLQSREFPLQYELDGKKKIVNKIAMRKVAYWLATDLYGTLLGKSFKIEHMNIQWEYDTILSTIQGMCFNTMTKRLSAISIVDPEINFVPKGNARYIASLSFYEFSDTYKFSVTIHDQQMNEIIVNCDLEFKLETVTTKVKEFADQAFQELLMANCR